MQERAELNRHKEGGMLHSCTALPPAPLPQESTATLPSLPAEGVLVLVRCTGRDHVLQFADPKMALGSQGGATVSEEPTKTWSKRAAA